MALLKWDQNGEKLYETGVDKGVLYVMDNDGTYRKGVAWNGLISVQETPGGADSNPVYANNDKYLDIRSAETFGATVQAYTFPEEFYECDGSKFFQPDESSDALNFVTVGQQSRRAFGLSYRTLVGNDVELNDFAYKLHLIYNATASPSQREYQTVNESPEQIQFSWEMTTTPVEISNFYKKSALITIDVSRIALIKDETVRNARLAQVRALEDALWGTDASGSSEGTDPTLVLPKDLASYFPAINQNSSTDNTDPDNTDPDNTDPDNPSVGG